MLLQAQQLIACAFSEVQEDLMNFPSLFAQQLFLLTTDQQAMVQESGILGQEKIALQ